MQLDIEASQSKEHIQETTSVASTVTGDNIYIQTGVGKDTASGTSTTIQGSHLNAENHLDINTGELNILASRDTLKIDTQSEQVSCPLSE